MLLWTWECMYLFELVFLFSSDIYPGVELLSPMVVLFLVFWETSILFSTVAAPIYIPTNSVQGNPHFLMSMGPRSPFGNLVTAASPLLRLHTHLVIGDNLRDSWIPWHPAGSLWMGPLPNYIGLPGRGELLHHNLPGTSPDTQPGDLVPILVFPLIRYIHWHHHRRHLTCIQVQGQLYFKNSFLEVWNCMAWNSSILSVQLNDFSKVYLQNCTIIAPI